MNRLRAFCERLAGIFHREQRDTELTAELESHLQFHIDDNLRAGMAPEEARRDALIKLGGLDQTKESYRAQHTLPWLESIAQDLRFALRILRKNPVFAATAILSLSLAIGANTAVYWLIDAAMLRPLPVAQPDSLFALSTPESDQPGLPASDQGDAFSYPLFEDLSAAAGDAAQIALFDSPSPTEVRPLDPNAAPEKAIAQSVSPNAFDLLGVGPATGRLFTPSEDGYPPARRAAVLSYQYWQARFGGDSRVIDRDLTVDGRTFLILGVTRKGFTGVDPGKVVDIWIPVTAGDPGIFTNTQYRAFHLIGRLAPGLTRAELAAKLQPAFHHHQQNRVSAGAAIPLETREQLLRMTLSVLPGAYGVSSFRQNFSRSLWILFGVSICIVLIACSNVASLLLARSAARSGEIALRVSLGAGRMRLVRQLLTESVLISAVSVPCAWVIARLSAEALVRLVSTANDPVSFNLALDDHVLSFCALLCAASALFLGLVPAWNASAMRPIFALRHAGGQVGQMKLGKLFVGIQVAFAFCLVTTGAGFLLSLVHLARVNRGFDARGVTVLTITNTQQRDRQWAAMQELLSRTSQLPGVQRSATGWMALFSGDRRAQRIVLPGKPPSDQLETFYRVSPGYFATLRTPLLAGRDFTFLDNDDEPVPTIVNRAFAEKYFGSDSVIGQEFRRDDGALHQIVGLAADSHFGSLLNGPEPIAYMPMKPPRIFTLYIRSNGSPFAVSRMVEKEANSVSSGVFVSDVNTLDILVGDSIMKERLLGTVGGALAVLGLSLAAVGLFGLLNYNVTRRTREIGIRAAIGGPRLQIYGLVLKDLLSMVVVGLAVGLAASLALLRVTHSLLFGVAPVDPVVIGTALAVFLGAAALAGAIPAFRAVSIDPIVALRQE